MKQYLDLMAEVLNHGVYKDDRTGTGCYSLFGKQMRFDLTNGQFPLVTTKKVHLKSIIHELLWFLKGDTNIQYLKENGVSIWDEWVKQDTAVYHELTKDEIGQALFYHFGKNCHVAINPKEGETKFELWSERPGETHGLVHVYMDMGEATRESILDGSFELASFQEAYRQVFKKEPMVLVSGELGPVYGAQWRSWPDPKKPRKLTTQERIDLWNAAAKRAFPYNEETVKLMNGVISENPTEELWDFSHFAKKARDNWGFKEGIANLYAVFDIPEMVTDPEGSIDQIANVVKALTVNPDSRRIMVSAWNPALVDEMALPPCHALFQFYSAPMRTYEIVKDLEKRGLHVQFVSDLNAAFQPGAHHDWYSGKPSKDVRTWIDAWLTERRVPFRTLSCQLYQRSADVLLGVPFNIASYALLTMMVAQVTNHAAGEFIWTGGDCHLYTNHLEQADLQLTRTPHKLPRMTINPYVTDLFDFEYEDFSLVDYVCDPAIKAPVAV